MNFKIIFTTLILAAGLINGVIAQQKVGYANIQAIMANMPETGQMQATLKTYSDKLAQSVTSRQQMLATLEKEYTDMQPTASQVDLAAKQKEYEKLYGELLQAQQEAQQKLAVKQQDLMNPILDKIQTEIKALAIAEGYDYIFNTVDGSGVSILLHGPEGDDLTVKLAARLGVKIPEGDQ